MHPRHYTVCALEAMDDGLVDAKTLAEAALRFMSEEDVKRMLQVNDLINIVDEPVEESNETNFMPYDN